MGFMSKRFGEKKAEHISTLRLPSRSDGLLLPSVPKAAAGGVRQVTVWLQDDHGGIRAGWNPINSGVVEYGHSFGVSESYDHCFAGGIGEVSFEGAEISGRAADARQHGCAVVSNDRSEPGRIGSVWRVQKAAGYGWVGGVRNIIHVDNGIARPSPVHLGWVPNGRVVDVDGAICSEKIDVKRSAFGGRRTKSATV